MKGKSSLIISVGVVAVAVLILVGLVTRNDNDRRRNPRCSSPEQIFDYAKDILALHEYTESLNDRCLEWVKNGAVDSQEKQTLTTLCEAYEATHDCLRSGFDRYAIACHNQLFSEESPELFYGNQRYVEGLKSILRFLRNSLDEIQVMLRTEKPPRRTP